MSRMLKIFELTSTHFFNQQGEEEERKRKERKEKEVKELGNERERESRQDLDS
jgi:hypothetical protein